MGRLPRWRSVQARRWCAALLAGLLVSMAAVPAQGCTGDCNGDGEVTIDELLLGVNIALGTLSVDACPRFDANGDSTVTITELLIAVNLALNGCPPNQAPLLSCFGLYRTYPGFPIAISIDASDPDGDTLRYSATDLPAGAGLDEASGLFTWTPTADQTGAFYVPFTVTDDGAPPLSGEGLLSFRVAPVDHCVQATCDPATGCEAMLLPLSQPCCTDLPARFAEPQAPCPQGLALFVGRNVFTGFGRLYDCDRMQVVNSGQTSAAVRFNIEARCLDTSQPVQVHARMVTKNRLVFDEDVAVFLEPSENGYAQRFAVTVPVETPGPFFDLEDADADFRVTVTDVAGVAVSTQLRPTLTFLRPEDVDDFDAPPPEQLGICQ